MGGLPFHDIFDQFIRHDEPMKKRLLIFVHYNQKNLLSEYVTYLVSNIRPLMSEVVFVSNTSLDEESISTLNSLNVEVVIRSNKGYDFGAWKDSLLKIGFENLASYDSITLMNDTCFGPIKSFEETYKKMDALECDFWGITNHKQVQVEEFGYEFTVEEHLQSYFLTFHKPVITHPVFQNFWHSVVYHDDVIKIIKEYETQLTKLLVDSGFIYKALIDTTDEAFYSGHPNLAHTGPSFMIENQSPLLKVKNFIEDPEPPAEVLSKIQNKTDYPTKLIYDHILSAYEVTLPKPKHSPYLIPKIKKIIRSCLRETWDR